MREINVTLVLNFGDDPGEYYSDSELLEAIVDSMQMEPIDVETETHETTFEIFGGKLMGNPTPYIICGYCEKPFPERNKITCYTIHPGTHHPCMKVFHDERCQELHRRDAEGEGKK